MKPLLGVDVSKYQGPGGMTQRHFQDLDAAGVRFIVARASIGTQTDPSAETNILRAEKLHWVTGMYHFLTPDNGTQQAEVYAQVCDDGLAVLDVEQAGVTGRDVKAFVRRFRELRPKQPLGVYTSEGAWVKLTGNMDGADLFDYLWQARWTELGTDERKDLPPFPPAAGFGGWHTTALWQYGAFHVDGYPPVDGDAWYGTSDELRALGAHPRPPLKDRPNYRAGHEAMLDVARHAVETAPAPTTAHGPAYDLGVQVARAEAVAAVEAQRLADPT